MAEAKPQSAPKAANRAIYVIFGVVAIAAVAVVLIMFQPKLPGLASQRTDNYAVLFDNLDLKDAAVVIESLKAQGVKDYKIENDGKTILVPRKKKDDIAIQIAGEGINLSSGSVGFEIFDKGGALGATDFDKQIKFSRAISGELSRSIARIYGVEEARVQVVIPEKQLFGAGKNPVQSSVFLKIKEGELLSPLQVQGIISLVASSVEDLKKENITVVDYYGRILSSDTYTKDYDRLLALMIAQKGDAKKNLKDGAAVLMSDASSVKQTSAQGMSSNEKNFFDIYHKMDVAKKDKEEKNIFKSLNIKSNMSSEDLMTARIKFKEKYEKLLEENVRVIISQFFPKNSTAVKVNVELNNQKVIDQASAASLISRITTMILLDQNNKAIKLTPEIREALMKGVASGIGYVKGRDRIDMRWAPMVNQNDGGWLGATAKAEVKQAVNKTGGNALNIDLPKVALPENSGLYALAAGGAWLAWYVLGGLFKKRKVIAEPAKKGESKELFEENSDEDFEDLKAPPVDQIRDLADKAPEKVAAVLEKWFQEDEGA